MDVCLGSAGHPWVSAPLRVDSAALVRDSLGRAEALVAAVTESLRRAVETSKRVMDELKGSGAAAGMNANQALITCSARASMSR
jgi:hypothetical protein